jgi:2-polyprenyl-6-hydroxyphenyl methylase / 3-demethylubiquinone-9 3-methyltransferase
MNIDHEEVEKFSKMAQEWWDVNGKFAPLHKINPMRTNYICDQIRKYFHINNLADIKMLDVGCGGGLLAEPLCKLGANITAIDASIKNINIATIHAKEQNLPISYYNKTIEEMPHNELYDVILLMEIIEHVPDPQELIKSASILLKQGGLLFVATINRNAISYIKAILGAEYILRWLPVGTHSWHKFIKPSEMKKYFSNASLTSSAITGMGYNMIGDSWFLSSNVDVNYIMVATK